MAAIAFGCTHPTQPAARPPANDTAVSTASKIDPIQRSIQKDSKLSPEDKQWLVDNVRSGSGRYPFSSLIVLGLASEKGLVPQAEVLQLCADKALDSTATTARIYFGTFASLIKVPRAPDGKLAKQLEDLELTAKSPFTPAQKKLIDRGFSSRSPGDQVDAAAIAVLQTKMTGEDRQWLLANIEKAQNLSKVEQRPVWDLARQLFEKHNPQ